jgi:glycosyltransferase involved in cell wall biosynthesis
MTSVQITEPSVKTGATFEVALVGGVDDNHHTDQLGSLAAALTERGHAVTVHTHEQARDELGGHGYRVEAVDLDGDALATAGEWAGHLCDAWQRAVPDVVHAYGWLPGVAAQLAARRQQVPAVQSFHNLAAPVGTGSRGQLETVLARGAAWATAGCTADLNVLARLRRNRARVSLVPAGVDADRFATANAAGEAEQVCRIACFVPSATLVDEVSRVLRALTALGGGSRLVVGATGAIDADGPWKSLRQLAADLGVTHLVTFLGHVGTDDVAEVLRSVDVLVCAATESPDPAIVLAAMASGAAVVACDVGALSDVVIHEVTGLLVPPSDRRELVLALKKLQAETFRRQGMGAAGRTRARSRYSWDRIAVDVEAAYRQVVGASI